MEKTGFTPGILGKKKQNVDDNVELMCTIGEEERCSVRVNLSKNTGYTGISILHRLHKLYGFDVIQDTVFDDAQSSS